MKTVFATVCFLAAASALAGQWAYDGGVLSHDSAGWTLDVSADGAGLTVTGVSGMPDGAAALPLDDAVAGGYRIAAIGEMAFVHCGSLTGVTIPNSVTNIAKDAFFGYTYLGTPDEVAYHWCSNLTDIAVAEDNTAYRGIGGVLFNKTATSLIRHPANKTGAYSIPSGVTSVGVFAFAKCAGLTDLTIPDSVTNIDVLAFTDCDGLTSVTIGSGMTSVTLPAGVTHLGSDTFRDCSSLTSVVIPDGVTRIVDSTFSGCASLKSVTLPAGVTRIGDWAFAECGSLPEVAIPAAVTRIGDWAFVRCGSLTSVTIPAKVAHIGEGTFYGCTGLIHIVVAEANAAYRSIGGVLFSKDGKRLIACPNGRAGAYEIPAGVTAIGDEAFDGCDGLTGLSVAEANAEYRGIGGAVFSKNGKRLVLCPPGRAGAYEIPAGVTSIGDRAFARCRRLTSVTIPKGVTAIGESAFYGCDGLTNVVIPAGVERIGNHVFSDCDSLSRVVIPASVTHIGYGVFSSRDNLKDITFEGSAVNCGDLFAFQRSVPCATIHVPRAHEASWAKIVNGSLPEGTAEWQGCPVRFTAPRQ